MKKILALLLVAFTSVSFAAQPKKAPAPVDCSKPANAKKNQCLKAPTSDVVATVKKPTKVRKAVVKKGK